MSEILDQLKVINSEPDIDLQKRMDKKLDLIVFHIIDIEGRTCTLEHNKKWVIGTAWTALIGFVGLLVKTMVGK